MWTRPGDTEASCARLYLGKDGVQLSAVIQKPWTKEEDGILAEISSKSRLWSKDLGMLPGRSASSARHRKQRLGLPSFVAEKTQNPCLNVCIKNKYSPHIFCDVDGVLADFCSAACKVHSRPVSEANCWDFFKNWGMSREDFWGPIHEYGADFYERHVAPYPWARDIINAIKEAGEFSLLTSVGEHPESSQSKINWIKKNIGDVEVILVGSMKCKSLFASPQKILIDDCEEAVDLFAENNGQTHLFAQKWNRSRAQVSKRVQNLLTSIGKWKEKSKTACFAMEMMDYGISVADIARFLRKKHSYIASLVCPAKTADYRSSARSSISCKVSKAMCNIMATASSGGWSPCITDKNEIIQSYDGKCKICGISPSQGEKGLNLDHCHKTGNFRGWLCQNCNFAVGAVKDSSEIARKMSDYLM